MLLEECAARLKATQKPIVCCAVGHGINSMYAMNITSKLGISTKKLSHAISDTFLISPLTTRFD